MSILSSLRTRIPLAIISGCIQKQFKSKIIDLCQVLAGRNDNYGEQQIERLMAVVQWNQRWFKCKTIFVEWNPPSGMPLLSKLLVERYPDVTCYVVPPKIHEHIAGKSSRPFVEYHAKNVGIRRATTEWVMACNSDVILMPDCLRELKNLGKENIPRTRRVDFPFSGRCPTLLDILDGRKYLRFRCIEGIGASAPGDCTIASSDIWNKARGYDESMPDRQVFCDVRGMHQIVNMGGQVTWIGTHFHFDHAESTSEGIQVHHGKAFDPSDSIPYSNPASWGLGNAGQRSLYDRIWELSI
jgi:hypothetical protein